MTRKQIFMTTVAGHLAALLLLYLPFALKTGSDMYAFLTAGLFNIVLIVASFIGALMVSIVEPWRPHAGAWWLGFGLLLLASFPVCYASMSISQAVN